MKKDLQNKFKVPDNYFTELGDDVLSKIESTPKAKEVTLRSSHWITMIMGVAASILLFVAIYLSWDYNSVSEDDRIIARDIIVETYLEQDDLLDEYVLEDEPLYAEILTLPED